jgi:serine protease Do
MNRLSVFLIFVVWVATLMADEPRSPTAVELQAKVSTVLDKVSPVVVGLKIGKAEIGSGVIVTEDGVVMTHGHHGYESSATITIVLADGKEVSARYQAGGQGLLYDFALLRIENEERWPHAELGRIEDVRPGQWCLHVGHPWGIKKGRPPVPRMGSIVETADVCLSSSCMIVGGDSGGPLFDERGRVIGLCKGLSFLTTDFAAQHTSVKVLRHALDEYLELAPKARKTLRKRIDRRVSLPEWNPQWEAARKATVQIDCDGRHRARGVVVGENGLILTKHSQLFGKITCRLSDERKLDAKIVAASQSFDLALLQVETTGLPAIEWSADIRKKSGTVLVVPDQTQSVLSVGIVSDERVREIAEARGWLLLDIEATNSGMKVIKINPRSYAKDVVEIGDTITQLDGSEVRTLDQFVEVSEKAKRVAGDRVAVSFLRSGKPMQASVAWSPETYGGDWERDEFNDRRSGFAAVFTHDAVITPQDCGGVVIDAQGRAVGLNIARADRHETHAIPAETVLRELQKLMQDVMTK